MEKPLGHLEHRVMVAVADLGDRAYGMMVRRLIVERTGRDVAIGAVYATLDRLEDKGLVVSWNAEATPERGGRARRFFRPTAAGERAIQRTWDAIDSMRETGS